MANKTNKMPVVLMGIIVIVVIVVVINSMTATPTVPSGAKAPAGPTVTVIGDQASADNTVETLNTVQAQYGELRRQLATREDQVVKLQETIGRIESKEPPETDEKIVSQIAKLQEQVSRLKVDTFTEGNPGNVLKDFGFNGGNGSQAANYHIGGNEGAQLGGSTFVEGRPSYRRLVPLTTTTVTEGVVSHANSIDGITAELASTSFGSSLVESGEPVYTIPARSTLFDATAMTALIGRVPLGGQVQDPFPVKIILGTDNMAANGHHIPGLNGIIFDGVARGDWSLSCVSVSLTGATYVFDDGTINHMPGDFDVESLGAGFGSSNESSIGYISDRQGVPCVSGNRITDAYKQAGLMTMLGAAAGYAEYGAESLKTTTVDGGTVVSAVTGDKSEFSKWGIAASGLEQTMNIFSERFEDTFDAIFVPPGKDIVIHVSQDLLINYNKNARRISYGSFDSPNSFH